MPSRRGTDKSDWRVCFHPVTGDHMPYVGFGSKVRNPAWQHDSDPSVPRVLPVNYEDATYTFRGTLKFDSIVRGRSSIKVVWDCPERDQKFTMFLAEFERILTEEPMTFVAGQIHGMWAFCKNGSDTGILKIEDPLIAALDAVDASVRAQRATPVSGGILPRWDGCACPPNCHCRDNGRLKGTE